MKVYIDSVTKEQPSEKNMEPDCGYCWDRRKKRNVELFFLDRANNMRPCVYCPICGRKYEQE